MPINDRIFFPAGLVGRDNAAANKMVAAMAQSLEDQYGLNLLLGAEQEYSLGQLAIQRSPRGDRFFNLLPAYDDLVMGEAPLFDSHSYITSAKKERLYRQFVLAPEAQTDETKTAELYEELVAKKRTELSGRFADKISALEQTVDARTLLNDWTNELQLLGDTITHRQQFRDELVGMRALREKVAPLDQNPNPENIEALREIINKEQGNLSHLVQTLVIDPNEILEPPAANPANQGHPNDAAFLTAMTPRIRSLTLRAMITGDPALYAEIQEKYVLDDKEIFRKKSAGEQGAEPTNEQIDFIAAKLLYIKMRDPNAVVATLDHHSPVVRRQRIQTAQHGTLQKLIYGEEDITKALDEFTQTHLYNDEQHTALVSGYYVGAANQVINTFGLKVPEATMEMTTYEVRDHMRKLLRAASLKTDFSAVRDTTEAKNQLKAHLEVCARSPEKWTAAAIPQRELAWRQTEMRELPEYQSSLATLNALNLSEEAWKVINDAIDANRIRRTYNVGSKLDSPENVLSSGLLDKLQSAGVAVDDSLKTALTDYLTTSSYVIGDLMVRDWRKQVETVYESIKSKISNIDPEYAKCLPATAVMDMHVEGGGAELAREAVTTPLPAEINRVVSRVMSGLLEGTLEPKITFTHQGREISVDIPQPIALCNEYPELFVNAHARGWQVPVGQHVHYSSVAKDPETGAWANAEGNDWNLKPYETQDKQPTDFAYYSHLSVLKLGPQFKAALGNTEGSLERWLYGMASPDHFRAMLLPDDYPDKHQFSRSSGDAVKIFNNHGELRAPATDADSRYLYAFFAIAQQHACDHYVIDKLATQTQEVITKDNLAEVIASATPETWNDDAVMQNFFKQSPQARSEWLERVGNHLATEIIKPNDFATHVTKAKTPDDKGVIVLNYEPQCTLKAGYAKGPAIVSDKEEAALRRNQSNTVTKNWYEKLTQGLQTHLPPALGKEMAQTMKKGQSAA